MAERLDKEGARMLSVFIQYIRPDWHAAGIMTALGNARLMGDATDLAIAAIAAAADESNRTPAVIAMQGPHWEHTQVRHTARPPTREETCGICYLYESKCRRQWSHDHEFESIADQRERAVKSADTFIPTRKQQQVYDGRPVQDVELP